VFGASPTTVFALNAATGKKIWIDRHLLNGGQGTFGIQPQVTDGDVYLASGYGSGPGGGVLLDLDASTGSVLWRFNTICAPTKASGPSAWAREAPGRRRWSATTDR